MMATHNRSATVTHRAKARRREWRAATGEGDIAPYCNGTQGCVGREDAGRTSVEHARVRGGGERARERGHEGCAGRRSVREGRH